MLKMNPLLMSLNPLFKNPGSAPELGGHLQGNSCSLGLPYFLFVSVPSLVVSHLVFRVKSAPVPDNCLLLTFQGADLNRRVKSEANLPTTVHDELSLTDIKHSIVTQLCNPESKS